MDDVPSAPNAATEWKVARGAASGAPCEAATSASVRPRTRPRASCARAMMATSHISGLYVKSKCSVHLDADYVAAYDEKSPTDWSEDVATLQALGIGPTSTVVDLGAGTGTFALAIAPHVARVVAVDVS